MNKWLLCGSPQTKGSHSVLGARRELSVLMVDKESLNNYFFLRSEDGKGMQTELQTQSQRRRFAVLYRFSRNK